MNRILKAGFIYSLNFLALELFSLLLQVRMKWVRPIYIYQQQPLTQKIAND